MIADRGAWSRAAERARADAPTHDRATAPTAASRPLVSVVTPFYNAAAYLPRAPRVLRGAIHDTWRALGESRGPLVANRAERVQQDLAVSASMLGLVDYAPACIGLPDHGLDVWFFAPGPWRALNDAGEELRR
ncbi:MAG: hypothetical protein JO189_33185, partial [Deltaproteobacteria bacterium]|nr:hypothetical protein [Deltaproteobacteria bacterium]